MTYLPHLRDSSASVLGGERLTNAMDIMKPLRLLSRVELDPCNVHHRTSGAYPASASKHRAKVSQVYMAVTQEHWRFVHLQRGPISDHSLLLEGQKEGLLSSLGDTKASSLHLLFGRRCQGQIVPFNSHRERVF